MYNLNFKTFYFLILFSIFATISGDVYVLKSLNVFFRHGDRTPVKKDEFYEKDPYKTETYEQFGGFAALTNEGKLREYVLGKSLRKLYGDSLPIKYPALEVEARSTYTTRTMMSSQLVLAGFFPPEDDHIWKSDLIWQPIPVLYTPKHLDPALKPFTCPKYKEKLQEFKKSEAYRTKIGEFKELMEKLTTITGNEISSVEQIWDLYHLFAAQQSAKLQLPEWTKKYYPYGSIQCGTLSHYEIMSFDKELKKFSGGLPLKKILKNMKKVSTSQSVPTKQKIFLFGVHEDNIAGIMIALGIWQRTVPEYSSAIIFELYQKDSEFYVKIRYYKGIPAEFEILILPGCTEFCPFKEFERLTAPIVSPENPLEFCVGSPSESKLFDISKDANKEDTIKKIYEKFEDMFDI